MVTDAAQHPLTSKKSPRGDLDNLVKMPSMTIKCNGMRLSFTGNQISRIAAAIKNRSYFLDLDS